MKNIKRFWFFSYFHISTCGQIWLNCFQADSHLDYITKLEKETLLGHPRVRTPYYCTSSLAYGSGFGICLIWKDMEEFPTSASHSFTHIYPWVWIRYIIYLYLFISTQHTLMNRTLKDMKIWKLYLIHNPEYMQEILTPKGRFVLTFW